MVNPQFRHFGHDFSIVACACPAHHTRRLEHFRFVLVRYHHNGSAGGPGECGNCAVPYRVTCNIRILLLVICLFGVWCYALAA